MPETIPDVLTSKEAADYLRLQENLLLAKVREGIIPATKIGQEWRFSRRQLLCWLEEIAAREEEDVILAAAAEEAYQDPDNQEQLSLAQVKARLER